MTLIDQIRAEQPGAPHVEPPDDLGLEGEIIGLNGKVRRPARTQDKYRTVGLRPGLQTRTRASTALAALPP